MSVQIFPKEHGEVRMCNCAGCKGEMLGESMRDWYSQQGRYNKAKYPPPVFIRIEGRPYCLPCARNHPRAPQEIKDPNIKINLNSLSQSKAGNPKPLIKVKTYRLPK